MNGAGGEDVGARMHMKNHGNRSRGSESKKRKARKTARFPPLWLAEAHTALLGYRDPKRERERVGNDESSGVSFQEACCCRRCWSVEGFEPVRSPDDRCIVWKMEPRLAEQSVHSCEASMKCQAQCSSCG